MQSAVFCNFVTKGTGSQSLYQEVKNMKKDMIVASLSDKIHWTSQILCESLNISDYGTEQLFERKAALKTWKDHL